MSNLARFKFEGMTYFYYTDKPVMYWYDSNNQAHMIVYECLDLQGDSYTVNWRIPGTLDRDIEYAKRMSGKLSPAYVVAGLPNKIL